MITRGDYSNSTIGIIIDIKRLPDNTVYIITYAYYLPWESCITFTISYSTCSRSHLNSITASMAGNLVLAVRCYYVELIGMFLFTSHQTLSFTPLSLSLPAHSV